MNNLKKLFILFFISTLLSNCGKNNDKIKLEKILLFGDSLMSGYGLEPNQNLSQILEKDLKSSGYTIEVINKSIAGDTTLDGLNRIDIVLMENNYDLVIIGLGANDMLRGIKPENIKRNLEKIIKKVKQKEINILLTGMVSSPSRGLKYKKEFDNIFKDLSDQYDLYYYPFLLKDVALKPKYNQPDGIHPNFKGLSIISKNLKNSIVDLSN